MLGYICGTVNNPIWQEYGRENKKDLDFSVGVNSQHLFSE